MNNNYSRLQIRDIARKLIAAIEYESNRILDIDAEVRVTVSVGVALMPLDGSDFITLYNNADKALYFVKQNGKRGFYFYRDAPSENQHPPERIQDFHEDNKLIDLMHLQMMIRESKPFEGVYKVEYTGFKRIYRFIARYARRTGQDVQLILFTITFSKENFSREIDTERKMEEAIKKLEETIVGTLRQGDVATRLGNSQYVIILMDTTLESAETVVGRIISQHRLTEVRPEDYRITYDVQSINKLP